MKKILYIKAILFSLALLVGQRHAQAQVGIGVTITATIPPPPLPVYVQPPCPEEGYIWIPGYWAYDPADGYYWVPGVWVIPPEMGYLWTPPYWGYVGGIYGWHPGYWGLHVGFYGGINYGCGYFGEGYVGGMWRNGSFHYNTYVTNVNTTIVRNVYVSKTVINQERGSRISFNGGSWGTTARATAQEETWMKERHVRPTSQQISHQTAMHGDRQQFASINHGTPPNVVMNKINGHRYEPSRAPNVEKRSEPASPNRNERVPAKEHRPSVVAPPISHNHNPAPARDPQGVRPEPRQPITESQKPPHPVPPPHPAPPPHHTPPPVTHHTPPPHPPAPVPHHAPPAPPHPVPPPHHAAPPAPHPHPPEPKPHG